MLYLLRHRRLREGALSVGPGLGARLHLGPAGDVPPLMRHIGFFSWLSGRWRALAKGTAWAGYRAIHKAPAVELFAWLPVGVDSAKPARGSVSFIKAGFRVGLFFGRSILARKWLAKMTKTRQNENENFQTMTNRDDL